jgi:hypothetical protein
VAYPSQQSAVASLQGMANTVSVAVLLQRVAAAKLLHAWPTAPSLNSTRRWPMHLAGHASRRCTELLFSVQDVLVVADMATISRSAIRGDFCDVGDLLGMGGRRRNMEDNGRGSNGKVEWSFIVAFIRHPPSFVRWATSRPTIRPTMLMIFNVHSVHPIHAISFHSHTP